MKETRQLVKHRVNHDVNGLSTSPTYNTWKSMISRCYCPKAVGYERYAGRGITVCERWRTSFLNFLEDMGERPKGMVIDRIDNDGNYEIGNCRWTTHRENTRNTRRTVRSIPFVDGETYLQRHRKTTKRWQSNNREHRKKYSKQYRATHKRHIKIYTRNYYRKWYRENRLRKLEYMRLRYLKKKALNEANS